MRLPHPRHHSTESPSDRNARIFNFLNEFRTGVLATVTPDGNPSASVIYYAVEPSFVIHFLTKSGTRKHDNLKHHDHAELVVYDDASQATVQVRGLVTEIDDKEKAHQIFRSTLRASLMSSDSGVPPIAKLDAGEYVAYELKPLDVKMAQYGRPDTGKHDELFETVALSGQTVN